MASALQPESSMEPPRTEGSNAQDQSQGGPQALAQSQGVELTQEPSRIEFRLSSWDGQSYTCTEFVAFCGEEKGGGIWRDAELVASESVASSKIAPNKKMSPPLPCVEPPSDIACVEPPSASSSVDTAAAATHQSIVVQIEKQPHTAIKEIFKSLNANCTFDDDLGSWAVPDTVDAGTKVALLGV